jgi:hypothetical protein
MQKAQGLMSKGRYVQSIDLKVPEDLEFQVGDPRCRVIFLDTNTGETGCTYMKLNAKHKGYEDESR